MPSVSDGPGVQHEWQCCACCTGPNGSWDRLFMPRCCWPRLRRTLPVGSATVMRMTAACNAWRHCLSRELSGLVVSVAVQNDCGSVHICRTPACQSSLGNPVCRVHQPTCHHQLCSRSVDLVGIASMLALTLQGSRVLCS